jgi:hypothetical protein
VGLVGLNNDFGKNIYTRNKNTFPENARTNPLDPLDLSEGTRARADDVSSPSLEREREIEGIGENDVSWEF